jgi:hypothetical protein
MYWLGVYPPQAATVAPPMEGTWKPILMSQGPQATASGVVCILWERVSDFTDMSRPPDLPSPQEYYGFSPGHEGEPAFRHAPEYGGTGPGDNPPGDLGNEVRLGGDGGRPRLRALRGLPGREVRVGVGVGLAG